MPQPCRGTSSVYKCYYPAVQQLHDCKFYPNNYLYVTGKLDRCGLHSFKSNYYSNSHRRMQRERQPFTFPPMSNLESSNIHHLFAITSFQNISIPRSCKVNNRSQSQMLVPGGLLSPPIDSLGYSFLGSTVTGPKRAREVVNKDCIQRDDILPFKSKNILLVSSPDAGQFESVLYESRGARCSLWYQQLSLQAESRQLGHQQLTLSFRWLNHQPSEA